MYAPSTAAIKLRQIFSDERETPWSRAQAVALLTSFEIDRPALQWVFAFVGDYPSRRSDSDSFHAQFDGSEALAKWLAPALRRKSPRLFLEWMQLLMKLHTEQLALVEEMQRARAFSINDGHYPPRLRGLAAELLKRETKATNLAEMEAWEIQYRSRMHIELETSRAAPTQTVARSHTSRST